MKSAAFTASPRKIFPAVLAFVLLLTPAGAEVLPSMDAEGYGMWLEKNLNALDADLESMTRSAEAAAAVFVGEKKSLRVDGKSQASDEILTRRGGFMLLEGYSNYRRERTAAEEVSGPEAVVIYILREGQMEDDVALLHKHREHGNYVVVFGRDEMRLELERQKVPYDSFVNNHSLPGGFLVPGKSGPALISTDRVSNVAALWVWQCEFVAACTRLGVMPILHMGYGLPPARSRETALRKMGIPYHEDLDVPPIPAGQAGRFYLDNIRQKLAQLLKNDLSNIRAVGAAAAQRVRENDGLYMYTNSHTLWSLWMTGILSYDPGYFEQIYSRWRVSPGTLAEMNAECLVVCMGWVQTDWYKKAREQGATFAWVASGTGELDRVAPGDFWIDLQTGFADAVVPIPGYDVNMAPTDGLMDEAIHWMLIAEVHGLLESPKIPNPRDLIGRTPLHRAVLQNDMSLVQSLIRDKADLSATDSNGLTPLHLAAWTGQEEMVQLLLAEGIPLAPADRYGRTPLHLAASANAREAASALLAAGALVDGLDEFGETPLHRAARNDAAETLKLLLDSHAGKALAIRSHDQSRGPLHVAVASGALATTQILLEAGASLKEEDYMGMQPLDLAAYQQNADMVNLLRNAGANREAVDTRVNIR